MHRYCDNVGHSQSLLVFIIVCNVNFIGILDFYTSRISEATTEGITISNFYTSRISEASISSQGSSSSVPSPGYGNGSGMFDVAN